MLTAVLIGVCLAVAFAACASLICFLRSDRDYWRKEYQARDADARRRELWLYDQLLAVKGFRVVGQPLTPQAKEQAAYASALSEDDLAVLRDRLREREEAGLWSPQESQQIVEEVQSGRLTLAGVERELWTRRLNQYQGSVAGQM